MRLIKSLVRQTLQITPYELRLRDSKVLPPPNFENVKLAVAYYLHAKTQPTLVQIGACDGISGDPLHAFIKSGRLRAVLVEPIPSSFRRLQQVYSGVPNVTLVNTAIAHEDSTMTLFKVKDGATSIDPYWGTQLASFDRNHILKHNVAPSDVEAVRVPGLTLASLAAQNGLDEIDILQVDTEGFDAEVVKMALQLPTPPECINFESINLTSAATREVFAALQQHGYSWIHDEWNTLALHERWMTRGENPSQQVHAAAI